MSGCGFVDSSASSNRVKLQVLPLVTAAFGLAFNINPTYIFLLVHSCI